MNTKTKKLLSILLSMVMLIGTLSLASVFAADKEVIDGLYVDYSGATTVTYATDKAYSGSRSIYIDAKSDSHAWIGDPVGDFKMDPAKAYGLEFYIYADSWTSGSIQLKPTDNQNNTYPTVYYATIENGGAGLYMNETNKARWGIEKITEGEKAGWYKVWNKTAIISEDGKFDTAAGYGKGYMWYTAGEMQVHLDNINVYEWTGYTTSQNSGTRGETPVFVQDFEEEVVVAPEVTLPDADDLDVDGVNLTLASGSGYDNSGAVYGITDANAYTGEKSLYVDSSIGKIGLGSCADDFHMVKNVPYGMKFSIYIAENSGGMLQIRPQNNQNQTYRAMYYTEISGTSETGLNVTGACANRWVITEGTGDQAGWYRFESTYPVYVENTDIAAFMPGLMFNFEGKFKAFIDDIEFYNWTKAPATGDAFANGMGTELIGNRDFEDAEIVEPEVPVVPVPDADDLDAANVGLTLATGEGYDKSGAVYGITDFNAYTGEKSLYVDSTSGKIGLGSCADDFGMVKGTAYGMKFSIYVAENTDGKLQIRPQNSDNQTYRAMYYTEISGTSENGLNVTGACKDRWTITEGTGEQAGWYRFESIYPVYVENTDKAAFMPGLMFNFEGKFKAFIDDLEFYNWTKAPATGDGFANGMGTELFASRTFEDAVVVAPELPNAEDLDVDNVRLALNPDYSGTKAVYGITDTSAFKGANSLYVDSTEGSIGLGSADTDFGMEKGTAYGLKFSIYVAENAEGVLEIKPQNSNNQTYKGNHFIEISGTSEEGLTVGGYCADRWKMTAESGEKKGWYTFETRFPILAEPGNENAGFLTGQMFNFKGKFKAFIDEVEVYNWDKALATGDGMKDGMGTTLLASRNFEYTGDYVGKFVKAVSGNNVTVSVDVRNCTKNNYTAQLFLAVYTGNTMDSIVSTGMVSIPMVDETADATTLSKTVTVPNGKTLKIFLWDSVNGMRPIKKHEIYTIGQ